MVIIIIRMCGIYSVGAAATACSYIYIYIIYNIIYIFTIMLQCGLSALSIEFRSANNALAKLQIDHSIIQSLLQL